MKSARKLVHLPGTRLTPEVVLHEALQAIDDVGAVVVCVIRKDGTVECDWSQMKLSDLSFALHRLQADLFEEINGG